MNVEVHLEVHRLALETGQWCPTCMFPSAVVIQLALVDSRTLRMVKRWATWQCTECESVAPGTVSTT